MKKLRWFAALGVVTIAAGTAQAAAEIDFCRAGWPISTTDLSCDVPEAASEVAVLAKLKKLKRLTLDLPMTSAEPLSGLVALENLELIDTKVTDLKPLVGLTALRQLHLTISPAADLTPLSALPNLEVVLLDQVPVASLAPLASRPKLRVLALDRTKVSDLSPLATMGALEFFSLRGGVKVNPTPLMKLPKLKTLVLSSGCSTPLTGPLPGVESVELGPGCIGARTKLAAWPKLRSVKVSDPALRALSALGASPGAPAPWTTLDVSESGVSSFEGIEAFPALMAIIADGTAVSSLAPLAAAKKLEVVSVGRSKVSSLAPLAGLPLLRTVDVQDTAVGDLSPLMGVKKLDILIITHTPAARDAAGLAALRKKRPKAHITDAE